MVELIEFDGRYSTTKILSKERPLIQNKTADKLKTMFFLPEVEGRKGKGGLLTRGYFKNSYELRDGKWYISDSNKEVKLQINNNKYTNKQLPLITVITVVLNGEKYLEETIKSVINQTYDNVEYIIIDGGSNDCTLDIIRKYEDAIDYWISEKDKGIYDAMNKGIYLATGLFLNFMNCGDCFDNVNTLLRISKFCNERYDVIYSNAKIKNSDKITKCDHKKMRLIHQSILYKKTLHDTYGMYLVAPKLSISDYIFFNLIKGVTWIKTQEIISIYDVGGLSSKKDHFYQKLSVDLLFGRKNHLQIALICLLYPFYKFIKNNIIKWFVRWKK